MGLIYSHDTSGKNIVYAVRIFKEDSRFSAGLKSNIQTFDYFEEWICTQGQEESSKIAIQSMLNYFYSDRWLIKKHEKLQQIIFNDARPDSRKDHLWSLYCDVVYAAEANDHKFFAALK